jgi:hypothetical protein
LIRASIIFVTSFSKKMDHRVKPGDDDVNWYDRRVPPPRQLPAADPPQPANIRAILLEAKPERSGLRKVLTSGAPVRRRSGSMASLRSKT